MDDPRVCRHGAGEGGGSERRGRRGGSDGRNRGGRGEEGEGARGRAEGEGERNAGKDRERSTGRGKGEEIAGDGGGVEGKGAGQGEYKLKNVNQSKEGWKPGGSIEAGTCCDAGISSRSPGGPICARAAHSRAAPSLHSSFQLAERLQAAAPGEEGEGEGGEQTGGGVECVQGEGGRGESVSISGSGGGGVCELSPGGTERIPPVFLLAFCREMRYMVPYCIWENVSVEEIRGTGEGTEKG